MQIPYKLNEKEKNISELGSDESYKFFVLRMMENSNFYGKYKN